MHLAKEVMMRLKHLVAQGFRAFAGRVELDLDADVVLIGGRNGTGKTSLFDAITWVLSGSLSRLSKESNVISLYSNTGSAQVSLDLVHGSTQINVTRRTDGERVACRCTLDGIEYDGADAEERILDLLWPSTENIQVRKDALSTGLTRSVYLQQDLIRQFVAADTSAERFKVLSELLGAGRIVDLQQSLEQARNSFTRNVLTPLQNEMAALNTRVQVLSIRIKQTQTEVAETVAARANQWRSNALRLLADLGSDIAVQPLATVQQMETVLRELGEQVLRKRRVRSDADTALQEIERIEGLNVSASTVRDMRHQLASHEGEAERLRRALAAAQKAEMDHRESAAKRFRSREELMQLARLALKHLGEKCPVCSQEYDRKATTLRLERIAGERPEMETADESKTGAVLEQLRNLERVVNSLRLALLEADEKLKHKSELSNALKSRLDRLGIPYNRDLARTKASVTQLRSSLQIIEAELLTVQKSGEEILPTFASLVERNQHQSMQKQFDETKEALAAFRMRYENGQDKYAGASAMITGLRRASEAFVSDRMEHLAPLLNRLYGRISPHPAFDLISLDSRTERGRGRVDTVLTDSENEKSVVTPADYLSSSQLNALAVVIFLSLNLSSTLLPLETAMLDDPLQSLDDINTLGTVDILRRIRGRRQLVVSTHDSRTAELLQRKLRPIDENEKTIRVNIEQLDRTEVDVFYKGVEFGGRNLKVVA